MEDVAAEDVLEDDSAELTEDELEDAKDEELDEEESTTEELGSPPVTLGSSPFPQAARPIHIIIIRRIESILRIIFSVVLNFRLILKVAA